MAIKKFKPTSPGRRNMTASTFEEVTTATPEKSLVAPLKKTGGRNNAGRITKRHTGGGHEHTHYHGDDPHHDHPHDPPVAAGTRHRHSHVHRTLQHSHPHFPDMHHEHRH